jgi:hypothetical protein
MSWGQYDGGHLGDDSTVNQVTVGCADFEHFKRLAARCSADRYATRLDRECFWPAERGLRLDRRPSQFSHQQRLRCCGSNQQRQGTNGMCLAVTASAFSNGTSRRTLTRQTQRLGQSTRQSAGSERVLGQIAERNKK